MKEYLTNEDWIDIDSRQVATGAAFPMVNLLITPVCLNDPKYNLEGPIGFSVLALCINSRLLTACMRVGLFRDVVPAVVESLGDKQSGCLED